MAKPEMNTHATSPDLIAKGAVSVPPVATPVNLPCTLETWQKMPLQVEHTAGFLFFWMFFLVGMVIPSLTGNPYDGYVHPIGGVTYQFSIIFSNRFS